ncbi:DUF2442 domain-containing protein [uncultured Polaribacter sp.]|uniref:DUF2442 domain-containing protein n=1 Tax=uncultured Polaribacter sp. TaxID=174711 RepID=UPI00261542A9|nr:DUF2442 domain-containing protein [uncultured Polaribacter sp.]
MEISKIWFENNSIFLETKKGIKKSMPLEWFPKLEKSTKKQRLNYELSPFGIHWEEIDEDLSFEGFFEFKKDDIKV